MGKWLYGAIIYWFEAEESLSALFSVLLTFQVNNQGLSHAKLHFYLILA